MLRVDRAATSGQVMPRKPSYLGSNNQSRLLKGCRPVIGIIGAMRGSWVVKEWIIRRGNSLGVH